MVDISAMLGGLISFIRAAGVLDTKPADPFAGSPFHGSPFYDVYRCQDGRDITVCALEPPFYRELLACLGLTDVKPEEQLNRALWPALKGRITALFASQPQAHWTALLEGSDVCFAPVLTLGEAAAHPHNQARGLYETIVDGDKQALRAVVAPRFYTRSTSQ
jgi:alpha-methylacyl-CoA racemase